MSDLKPPYEIVRSITGDYKPTLFAIAHPMIQHIEVFGHLQHLDSFHRGHRCFPAQCLQMNDLRQPTRISGLTIELYDALSAFSLANSVSSLVDHLEWG